MEIFVLMIIIILACVFLLSPSEGWNVQHPQHLGLGAYPPGLYGEQTQNRYYNEDLKAALRLSDHYGDMAGLKFPSYDINDYLETGRRHAEKKGNVVQEYI